MATLQSGAEKYGRKTGPGSAAEQKYNAAKGRMVQNWVAGLQRAGVTPGPISTSAYQQGISAAQYRGGDASKWLQNLQAALSR